MQDFDLTWHCNVIYFNSCLSSLKGESFLVEIFQKISGKLGHVVTFKGLLTLGHVWIRVLIHCARFATIRSRCRIEVSQILGSVFSDSKVKSYADEKSTLDEYRTKIKELQTTARTQRIEENAALLAKQEEENTLKGKTIKSINVVPVTQPTVVGLLSIIAIGVEFTLDNGKVLKTKNLGGFTPYTDFEAEVSGGDFAGGDFKVADDSRKIPGDKIEITVWSKYDAKKIKGKYTCPANYKTDINYNFSGASGASGRGGTVGYTINGKNGTDGKSINVSVTAMQLGGEQVNKIVITDAYSGSVITEAKMNTNYTLNINANGGNGGSGSVDFGNGGSGGDAGNGGNVVVSGSGASSLKISVTNNGGTGGVGGKAKTQSYSPGTNGRNGSKGIFSK